MYFLQNSQNADNCKWKLDRRLDGGDWFLNRDRCRDCAFLHSYYNGHGPPTQQPILRVPRVFSPGVILPMRETDLLPASEIEF
jgi:hypothetical protein